MVSFFDEVYVILQEHPFNITDPLRDVAKKWCKFT